MINLRISVPVPDFIGRIAEAILQIYSRLRYGRDSRLISLGLGKFAIVDADDHTRLAAHTWYISCCARTNYAVRPADKPGSSQWNLILMHREVLESPKGLCVDHINGNGLDNRRANLRLVTRMQNTWNMRKRLGGTSRFKGVSKRKNSKTWRAMITCRGKQMHIGSFDDEEAAARAYDAKALELYGQYARLNLPDG